MISLDPLAAQKRPERIEVFFIADHIPGEISLQCTVGGSVIMA